MWILTKLKELLHSPYQRTHLHNDDAKFPVPQDPIDTSSPTEPVHLELRMPESTNPIRDQSPQFAGRLQRETKEEHVGTGIVFTHNQEQMKQELQRRTYKWKQTHTSISPVMMAAARRTLLMSSRQAASFVIFSGVLVYDHAARSLPRCSMTSCAHIISQEKMLVQSAATTRCCSPSPSSSR